MFSDAAISGPSDRQPDYQAMLAEAREAAFDVIFSESLDRLSRVQEHIAAVSKRCVCRSGFSKISATHFGCSGARNKGEAVCGNRATIRRDKLERTVLDGLRNRLMDPAVYRAFADAFVSEWNRQVAAASGEGAKVRSELARINGQIERLIDAVADGDVTGTSIRARLEALEKHKEELTATLSEPAPVLPHLHPNLAEVYRQEIASLAEALDADDATGAQEMVRGLIDSITIHAPAPDGNSGRRVELRGKLAAVLALGRGGGGVGAYMA